MNRYAIVLVGLLVGLAMASCAPQARPPRAEIESHEQAAARGDEVNLLAIADWGMNNDQQRRVADAMKDYVQGSGVHFSGVLCAGDNMYVSLRNIEDPLWQQTFETMYDRKVIDFPFYVVAGNHDYQNGKVPIELQYARDNPQSRWKYPAPYYRVDFPEPSSPAPPLVSVLMLDSNRDSLKAEGWDQELRWLREELAKPQPADTWRIAVAHHPLFSNGQHGDNGVLQTTWGKLFKQYGLDLYLCGHDHDLQHLELSDWPMSFLLVGGGGAKTRSMVVDRRGPFSKSTNGFAHLQFSPKRMVVRIIDSDGQILHTFERNHAGQVQILHTVPSDVGKPRTAKTINRPDATRPSTQPSTQRSTPPTARLTTQPAMNEED